MRELPDTLPPRPEPPVNYDCCGGGCADCELRIYQRELVRWKKMEAAMKEGKAWAQAHAAPIQKASE